MTAHALPDTDAPSAAPRIVLLCRSPADCRLVERAAGPVRAYASAMEALLALVRERPRAIVFCAADFDGREGALLAAIRRAQPDVPVYILVPPEDEPRARRLVEAGASDYAVLPDGLDDLRAMLSGERSAETRVPLETEAYLAAGAKSRSTGRTPAARDATPPPATPDARPFFDAACALADLAPLGPAEIVEKGGRIILEAAEAERGGIFVWNAGAGRLEPRPGLSPEDGPTADEQALAERAVRTGETLLVAPAAGAEAGRAILCVPVRAGGDIFGAISLAGADFGGDRGADVRAAVEALARALAHLVRAASRRP